MGPVPMQGDWYMGSILGREDLLEGVKWQRSNSFCLCVIPMDRGA